MGLILRNEVKVSEGELRFRLLARLRGLESKSALLLAPTLLWVYAM